MLTKLMNGTPAAIIARDENGHIICEAGLELKYIQHFSQHMTEEEIANLRERAELWHKEH